MAAKPRGQISFEENTKITHTAVVNIIVDILVYASKVELYKIRSDMRQQ